jgi:ACS family sodium-dependent inorganic phosphate cotransporter/ACS family sodium-dependent inorganic phosphate cotransporter-like MFS transporter 9
VCGFVLEKTGSFTLIFQATAVLYVLGTLVWNAYCRTDPQF